ncbi:hypothetical protein MTP03_33640 [Tsukamurella sp. PLM1]|nr:hypothetical protein MTP03_33640 [Tsukamurella sp. PLM1]
MNASTTQTDDFDLVIIGAGIAGIGAAKYFTEAFPGKRIAMLEGRANIGGTWDLFKYPGIRSDNGLHTYGYEFKPWTDPDAIAEAPKILNYLQETVDEYDLGELIRFEHSVQHASWSSADARWTLDVRTPEGRSRSPRSGSSPAPATTATTRATPRTSRGARTSAATSSTRSTGPRTTTTPARRSWSSAAAPPPSP